MGKLVAKRYPTNLVAGLADHTYVECGTGSIDNMKDPFLRRHRPSIGSGWLLPPEVQRGQRARQGIPGGVRS
jgi:hypothetical protein